MTTTDHAQLGFWEQILSICITDSYYLILCASESKYSRSLSPTLTTSSSTSSSLGSQVQNKCANSAALNLLYIKNLHRIWLEKSQGRYITVTHPWGDHIWSFWLLWRTSHVTSWGDGWEVNRRDLAIAVLLLLLLLWLPLFPYYSYSSSQGAHIISVRTLQFISWNQSIKQACPFLFRSLCLFSAYIVLHKLSK